MKKVHIESDGTRSGTIVTTSDGTPVPGLTKITITMGADGIPRARLEVGTVTTSVDADSRLIMMVGGRVKDVKRVEFTDGSEISWEDQP